MSTLGELRTLAKQLGIKGVSTARKEQLVKMIETHHSISKIQSEKAPKEPKEPARGVPEIKVTSPKESEMIDMVSSEPEAKKESSRKSSKWNEFLKSYRAEHNCSLREAMSAKDKYIEWKTKN